MQGVTTRQLPPTTPGPPPPNAAELAGGLRRLDLPCLWRLFAFLCIQLAACVGDPADLHETVTVRCAALRWPHAALRCAALCAVLGLGCSAACGSAGVGRVAFGGCRASLAVKAAGLHQVRTALYGRWSHRQHSTESTEQPQIKSWAGVCKAAPHQADLECSAAPVASALHHSL